ncbi:MAG: hypothetical protein OEV66_03915 [Spirochaetia bacterium]|nr:hypothetical protein [Spirochaetia bacterium]
MMQKKGIYFVLICFWGSCAITSRVGTVENPEILNSPSFGYPISVSGSATAGKNYFYASAVISGSGYQIDLTNLTSNLDLFVFSDNAFSYGHLICSSRLAGTANDSCTVNGPAGSNPELFIMIDNYAGIDATYTLTVTQIN